MFKKLVLIVVVLTALFALTNPVFAIDTPGTYYVVLDTQEPTNLQNGSEAHPFKTVRQAIAEAQHNPNGGVVCLKATQSDANWDCSDEPIPTTNPPGSGTSISGPAMFVLLGFASLILMAIGWFMMRRARTLSSRV